MTKFPEIAKRLREFGESHFPTMKEFANALGITPQDLNKYLSGSSRPGIKMQERLNAIGCDVHFLMYGETIKQTDQRFGRVADRISEEHNPYGRAMSMVPFLGRIVASPEGKEYFEEVGLKDAAVPFFAGNFFALEVENDSMINAPTEIYPGDICIFETGKQPRNGNIVAVQFKQSNERAVKILYHVSKDEIELRSANKFRNYPSRKVKKTLVASYGIFVTKIPLSEELKKRFGLTK